MTIATLAEPTTTGGLTSQQAEQRFAEIGPNDPVPRRQHSALRELLQLFLNPLVLILLIASAASTFSGQFVDGGIIAVILLLSIALDFFQTYRSQNAIEQLRKRVTPTATVLRDGEWKETPQREVVPGDWVRLSAGDLVPADAILLESHDLFVQQSALTGESLPAEKEAGSKTPSKDAEDRHMVFLGTSVISGSATAQVVETGVRTGFGGIAARLQSRHAETAFDRGLREFSLFLARTVLFLVVFLIAVSIALHRDPLQSILFAVALAVGLTPEFLPMITSITLAKGAIAMARKSVIVKHLSAIQNLGSVDILCTDKTGTLTTGVMSLESSLDPLGKPSERALALAFINSKFETGIRSPLDETILRSRSFNSDGYTKYDEIPFDFERRRLSIVVDHADGRILIAKGAPEGIFPQLNSYEIEGRVESFKDDDLAKFKDICNELGKQGYRVIAVAYAHVENKERYTAEDECNLIFAGLLTFSDPPLPDAAESLKNLRDQGVQIKIISGDNDLVAAHVCAQVGMDAGTVVTGQELDNINDIALAHVAEETQVFARISPAQKNRILLALQHRGHVVGFMGDGINDAPSLRAGDVGISVSTAVDVAREAADIILVEPGFRVLREGIIEGRRAFGNVMKYLLMGTSSNFGNMFSMAGAALFLPFLPMLPRQILLNTFLYDLAQITIPTDKVDDAYLRNPQHWDVGIIRRFMLWMGPVSSIFDFITFYVLLHVFHSNEAQFHTGWFVESLATQTLVLLVIRTTGNPLRNLPSRPLLAAIVLVVLTGILLPFSPLAGPLGFTHLPPAYFGFLAAATFTYLLLVQFAKRWLLPRVVPSPA